MDIPKELEVECLLCKEILTFQSNNTSILVDHVKLKHPDIKISNLPKDFKFKPRKHIQIPSSNHSKSEKTEKPGTSLKMVMEENKPLCECECNNIPKYTQNNQKKERAMKTVKQSPEVEKWKPGSDKIFCPKCDSNVRPIIRTSADRVSHSPFGAALIMTCWPFCFFPFLFPAPIQEHLHCSICGHYFGSYDHRKETMNVPKQPINTPKERINVQTQATNTNQATNIHNERMNVPKKSVSVPDHAVNVLNPAMDVPNQPANAPNQGLNVAKQSARGRKHRHSK